MKLKVHKPWMILAKFAVKPFSSWLNALISSEERAKKHTHRMGLDGEMMAELSPYIEKRVSSSNYDYDISHIFFGTFPLFLYGGFHKWGYPI